MTKIRKKDLANHLAGRKLNLLKNILIKAYLNNSITYIRSVHYAF